MTKFENYRNSTFSRGSRKWRKWGSETLNFRPSKTGRKRGSRNRRAGLKKRPWISSQGKRAYTLISRGGSGTEIFHFFSSKFWWKNGRFRERNFEVSKHVFGDLGKSKILWKFVIKIWWHNFRVFEFSKRVCEFTTFRNFARTRFSMLKTRKTRKTSLSKNSGILNGRPAEMVTPPDSNNIENRRKKNDKFHKSRHLWKRSPKTCFGHPSGEGVENAKFHKSRDLWNFVSRPRNFSFFWSKKMRFWRVVSETKFHEIGPSWNWPKKVRLSGPKKFRATSLFFTDFGLWKKLKFGPPNLKGQRGSKMPGNAFPGKTIVLSISQIRKIRENFATFVKSYEKFETTFRTFAVLLKNNRTRIIFLSKISDELKFAARTPQTRKMFEEFLIRILTDMRSRASRVSFRPIDVIKKNN